MGLAFPAMGYSLIDGKTYRQINLKPTGFSKDPGGSMLRYTPPPRGQFAPLRKPAGGQHAPQHNLSKNIGGQHPPLWHAHTMRTGTWLIKVVDRRWGSACSALSKPFRKMWDDRFNKLEAVMKNYKNK